MKNSIFAIAAIFFLSVFLCATSYEFQEKEGIQKTLKFQDPSKLKEVQIDNIFGSINVQGYNGQDVQLLVHKTIKGRTKEKIQKAKEEVRLDISEDGNTIDLYVDGPFRCKDEQRKRKNRYDPGYKVVYDFELKVPRKTNLHLKTVTEGHIVVKNIEGEFEINNVNGRIELTEVAGSGDAHTVNGKVIVFFSRNPKSNCSFRTINGNIEASFLQGLSADFRLKTFNGDAYSDFPLTYLPISASSSVKREKGKFVYKSNQFTEVRNQKGGPEIKMDTFNGDILIAKKDN